MHLRIALRRHPKSDAKTRSHPKAPRSQMGPEIGLVRRSLLFAGANHDRHNVFHIDKRIERFCASQMGKMNHVFGKLFDFPADFVSRIQAQLDGLAGAIMEDVEDGRVGLQIDPVLSEHAGTESYDHERD